MLCSGFYFLDIIIFTRRNLVWGIPDHFFILGSTCQEIVRQWQWVPGIVVMSQLCPKGMEATMFSLLAGCHNLGSLIADYLGAFMLEFLQVNPSGGDNNEEAAFTNLWKASIISTSLPMLTILLIPVLIREHQDSATWGSPLSRWLGAPRDGAGPGTPPE